jgi:hypothetical protein
MRLHDQFHQLVNTIQACTITKVSGYVDTPIPKKCGTCKHISDDRKHCDQKTVMQDSQIKTDPATKTKIVCAQNGCCNEWQPK